MSDETASVEKVKNDQDDDTEAKVPGLTQEATYENRNIGSETASDALEVPLRDDEFFAAFETSSSTGMESGCYTVIDEESVEDDSLEDAVQTSGELIQLDRTSSPNIAREMGAESLEDEVINVLDEVTENDVLGETQEAIETSSTAGNEDVVTDFDSADDFLEEAVCETEADQPEGSHSGSLVSQAEILQTLPETLALPDENSSASPDEETSSVPETSYQTDESECSVDCYMEKKEFFFETDHPALKRNGDYRRLLYTVLELEARRARAIRDLEKLHECENEALADPVQFVSKLQRGEDVGIPRRQKIPELPDIDWNKYALTSAESGLSKRQLTRHSSKTGGTDFISMLIRPDGPSKSKKVRIDAEKPLKFSQPWTVEEQKKLEELLMKYPPEEIESRRWEKIASALGTRTPTQVASRVQKYFIKLMKAGMPIPGRQPSSSYLRKPRRHVVRQQPSTFFASQMLPTYISEDDIRFSRCDYSQPPSDDDEEVYRIEVSDEEDIPLEERNTPEYMELMSLKRAMKMKRSQYASRTARHIGYKCTRCHCNPIIGVRWHCTECPSFASVDFCEDCVDSMHETETHSAVHTLEALRYAGSVAGTDSDYTYFSGGDINYLDPNYMPAT